MMERITVKKMTFELLLSCAFNVLLRCFFNSFYGTQGKNEQVYNTPTANTNHGG
jgi:hypothetical protein